MTTAFPDGQPLLPHEAIERALNQLARQLQERHPNGEKVVLMGIQTGGVQVARHLARRLETAWGHAVPVGAVDVSLHRDDLDQKPAPEVHATCIPQPLDDCVVVLVDDVFSSGRTCRAAMDALTDLGRPARIEFAVLIARNHPELPIRPDYVGYEASTGPDEHIEVQFDEATGEGRALIRAARTG